jgi:hypothetical protein
MKKLVPDMSASLLTEEEQTRLLGVAGQGASPNPMVRRHGFGDAGKTCKNCQHHLVRKFSKAYHKCGLNEPDKYGSTDIRISWDACAKFEEISQ